MISPFQKALDLTRHIADPAIASIEEALHEAMEHVGRHAKSIGLKQINLLLVGGASLHLSGFREGFSDIDLLIKELELSSRMEPKLLTCPKSHMAVELCYDKPYGALEDKRLFERAMPIQSKSVGGVNVSVGLYPPEYFLLRILEMGRQKCQKDIQNMLMGIPLTALGEAFNELSAWNEAWLMSDLANMLITDLVMLNLPGKASGDSPAPIKAFCASLNVDEETKGDLMTLCSYLDVASKPKKAAKATSGYEYT